jgi:glycosyltransferase involved in cell wall biosynthesis
MYNIVQQNNKYRKFFLWKNYINQYKDLQDARINTEEKAWKHFANFGWKEERYHAFKDLEIFNDYLEMKNYNILFKKNYKLYNEPNKITMNNLNKLEPETLTHVNNNIDTFMKHCECYKNILFICGDYPSYGGASTNCFKLQQFFKQRNYNTYSIFFNFPNEENKKYIETHDHCIVDYTDILKKIETLQELHFIPDLIILRSFTNSINFKHYFPYCTIFYLIGGIYTNELDKPYDKLKSIQEHSQYMNQHVVKQIRNSDYAFCNSAHTCDTLQKIVGITTTLFYSSFVPYYKKKPIRDKNKNNREYKYGLIISNFNRKIKNASESVQFLKDKKDVLLIGKYSSQYQQENENFKCIELQNLNRMDEHYKKIKYVVQDSFYESCSNVRVEALFNACKIIKNESIVYLPLNLYDLNHNYVFDPNVLYILSHDIVYFDIHNMETLFVNNVNLYLANNANTKDIILTIKVKQKRSTNLIDVLREAIHIENVVGNSEHQFTNQELINLYYLLGNSNIDYKSFGLSIFYQAYLPYFEKQLLIKNNNNNHKNINRTFNKKMLTLCYSYYLGKNNKNIFNITDILQNEHIFHTKKCLIISKLIKGFGGVQKTSKQLIETLDEKYDVELLSCVFSKNCDYDLKLDALCNTIPNCIIIKLKKYTDIIQYINSQNYETIVVNKLNEIFDIIKAIDTKPNLLIHNPMDSMNDLLLKNSENVNKIFVINNYHRNLLKAFGIKNNIYLYNNYVFDKDKNPPLIIRKEFKNAICFIGRITSEKNIELLIDAFTKFQEEQRPELKLFIIGENNARDYSLKQTNNKNIIFTGRITFEEITKYLNECDYTISASFTEGKPFSVIEGMSYGIPCIHSNISGIDELIINNISGFTFNFEGYEHIKYRFSFDFFDFLKKHHNKNIVNLYNCLCSAYKIPIEQWNNMSNNCIEFCTNRFSKDYCSSKNLKLVSNNMYENKEQYTENNNQIMKKRKYKIFCSFKPDMNVAHGGGNISVFYIIRLLLDRFSDFDITYELCKEIDLYFMVDVLKDRGQFKKYDLETIIDHKMSKNQNPNAKIILRVNDCDITRKVNNTNSREKKIIQYYEYIDYFVYNSIFIRDYYFDKFQTIDYSEKPHTIIHNGCDQKMFSFTQKQIPQQQVLHIQTKKIKIVTHHWSSNLNKGYQTYYNLWKHLKNTNNKRYEFIFIGKNVPDMFSDVKITGPFVNYDLSNELNKCHIYITDSRYDACPNHVIEAISCGLPVLYSDVEGGARELCQKSTSPIGEMYTSFENLLEKIDLITNNYQYYLDNIKENLYLYAINTCVSSYYSKIIYNICSNNDVLSSENINIKNQNRHMELENRNNIIRIHNKHKHAYVLFDDITIKLSSGENVLVLSSNYTDIILMNCDMNSVKVSEFENNKCKLNNDKFNILLCSDKKYLVGLFAVLQSIITNVEKIEKLHFNFIISIEASSTFANMLHDFENINELNISHSIVFIDEEILDPVIINSKCFNSGGHLLNIGNISRLLLGEFFEYTKMLYLDCDSVVQYDVYEKLKHVIIEHPICAPRADKHNVERKKNIVIKNSSIINCDYDWTKLIETTIEPNEYVYMGAPFIANCSKWNGIYKKMLQIISIHNNYEQGLFKLFTMSLQNIIFYNKTENLNNHMNVLQDLGSNRKEWAIDDLVSKDVLDWSGVYKPWYESGQYKHLWDGYDVMKLSTKEVLLSTHKNDIEQYSKKIIANPVHNKQNTEKIHVHSSEEQEQLEKDKEEQLELEKDKQKKEQQQLEKDKQEQLELEKDKQKKEEQQLEKDKQEQLELELEKDKQKKEQQQLELEKDKQEQLELELEKDKQEQLELELEKDKQEQLELEKDETKEERDERKRKAKNKKKNLKKKEKKNKLEAKVLNNNLDSANDIDIIIDDVKIPIISDKLNKDDVNIIINDVKLDSTPIIGNELNENELNENELINTMYVNDNISIINNFVDNSHLKLDKYLLNDTNNYLNSFLNVPKKKNYKYNVCYVCDLKYMISKMSRVRFWAIEELGNHSEIKLHMIGPNFANFNALLSIQQNILNMNINFDAVFWYKPLDKGYNFNPSIKLPFKTYIRYNEMWDTTWTQQEINESNSDIIISHHKNDYLKYCQLYANDKNKTFYYCAHHANPRIFKSLHGHKDIDILLSGVCKEKHYPLKYKLLQILQKYKKTELSQYNIVIHQHPGYNHTDSFKNKNQIEYNSLINRSKICIACTSKHKYRLGKYVEIPMAGSLILGDIPFEDQENFKKFILEVNLSDTDEQILSVIKDSLNDFDLMQEKIAHGLSWAKKHTTKRYVDDLYNIIENTNNNNKILIISDEIKPNHPEFKNQKWICDQLKEEFTNEFPEHITNEPSEASIVWYLACWNTRYIPKGFTLHSWQTYLKEKKVIFTQHHIDETKYQSSLKSQFKFMQTYGNKFHTICNSTRTTMQKYFPNEEIINYPLWINNKMFYEIPMDKKQFIRKCFEIDEHAYLIGSFQKDTEGKTDMPKLSKGADIFVQIIKDIHKINPNVQVVLTGLRREYIIKELSALKIKYYYFNMVSLDSINQLYNCLNLYISASRCEGGPRSVVECGLTKTPIISTRVGIAPELMDNKSLFDADNWQSYKNAIPNSEYLHNKVLELTTHSHKKNLLNILLN